MDEVQDESQENKDVVVESENKDVPIDSGDENPDAKVAGVRDSDPHDVKSRLGRQAKRYQREIRALQDQISELHGRVGQQNFHENPTNPYSSPGQPQAPGNMEEERIQRAVKEEVRRAKEAEQQAHVQRQYHRLQDEFDSASDRYEDFDNVVRGHDVPFTHSMRDALLLIDNPADVAYKLGKNRQELSRISQLHPLDQAREINKLSFALMSGHGGKQNTTSSKSNPLNPIKANPAISSSAKNMSASSIRERIKAGTWK